MNGTIPQCKSSLKSIMTIKKNVATVSIILLITMMMAGLAELCAYVFTAKAQLEASSTPKDLPSLDPEQLEFFTEYQGTANIPYKSHVGWQSKEFHGRYINITGKGLRATGSPVKSNTAHTIHFFGGSTMWGYGVRDDGAIPSLFTKRTGLNSINYAELAWTNRQSLNRLISNLSEIQKGDSVVFYDGYNDAVYGCYPGMVGAHAREQQINDALSVTSYTPYGRHSLLFGLTAFVRETSIYALYEQIKSRRVHQPDSHSDCTNHVTAEAVSDFIINNWRAAEQLVKSRGANFYCILQPSSFFTERLNPKTTLHDIESITEVYPYIIRAGSNLSCFVDLSRLKIPKEHYFDIQAHLTREGNEIIAGTLAKTIE